MNVLLHIGAAQALFLGVFIITKRKKILSDYILFAWFIIIAANMFLYHLVLDHEFIHLITIKINYTLYFIHPALFYLYIKYLLYPKTKRHYFSSIHLLPAIFIFTYLSFTQLHSYISANELLNASLFIKKIPILLVFNAILMILYIIYPILILKQLTKYKKQILNKYSTIEQINMQWVKHTIIGFFFIIIIFFTTDISAYIFQIITPADGVAYTITICIATIFYLSYHGFRQGQIFNNLPNYSNTEIKIVKNIPDNNTDKNIETPDLYNKLTAYMTTQKPYLNSQLTIKMLANETNIPVTVLSKLINTKHQNYFEYINKFRVDEFKKQILFSENEKYTIETVAYKCGFNSKSSFYNIFKKHAGITPLQYKNNIVKEQNLYSEEKISIKK